MDNKLKLGDVVLTAGLCNELGAHGVTIAGFDKSSVMPEDLFELAQTYSSLGLIESIPEFYTPVVIDESCVAPWKITKKGRDELFKQNPIGKAPLQTGIFDFNINLVIGSGSGSIHKEHHQHINVTTNDVHIALGHIVSQIDNSAASDEEKKEAKSKLQSFLTHPLVVELFKGAVEGVVKGATG